ncbi:hypothetical protein BDZ90DRAFT_280786 [Jaminaea rosea]|uniref:Alpha-mannosidase n=1 Tax=Jaminaea rosea TaxID=1569628 RepID=A0A316ULZ4_9BASI|nr:hypothetical protein BDZ90DRAFT_280786 [Jaminaea rosea]PWN26260.1 hypothetical protein BDZ90DRAFT_280786 [Jaminaea rosea]
MPPTPQLPRLASSAHRPVRGLSIRSQDERRLPDFVGGQYAAYNLSSVLFEDRTDDASAIALYRWSPPAGEKPSFSEAVKHKFEKASKGDLMGPSWSNHWCKLDIAVPAKWQDKEWVELEFDPSCEGMIFDVNGKALQGITGGGDMRRVDFPLKGSHKTKPFTLYIECSCNGMFGVPSDHTGDPDPNRSFRLESCDIVVKRPQAWRLLWDWEVLRGCVNEMPKDGVLQNKALWVCNKIMSTFRRNDLKTIDQCRKIAEEVLGTDWERSDIYAAKKSEVNDDKDALVWSLGHTHIDTAWLWPFSATQQKVARSWSTQLDLLERYPEYKFTASSAIQFQWLEQLYPELFERVKKQVEAGRFVPIGGTWVENDANMPSGEAFARQFVYGQRYFKSRFGKDCDIFWLPDTFGYNAQIPQLARGAGCQSWLTQKLSWSSTNTFPSNSFVWVGLDGSQIMTHMPPADKYDSRAGVDDIRRSVTNNKNLGVQPKALLLFGFGDGGGGPTAPMLESFRRARAIHNAGFTEMPKLAHKTAGSFFDNILEATELGERLPTWQGEIYLEFHRGVQTSHGSIKKWNRKLEILLHNVEWVATCASLQGKYTYPKSELDSLWEPLLQCQFHDVLPGSSIRLVYDDAEKIYADIDRRAKKLLADASHHLPQTDGVVSINTLGIPRRELVEVSINEKSSHEAEALRRAAVQVSGHGDSAFLLMEDLGADGRLMSCPSPATVMRGIEAVSINEDGNGSFTMRSSNISIKVAHGRIASIYDIGEGRELIAPGRTAGLSIAEDYSAQFDAWELESYSLDTMEEIRFDRCKIAERGPWRASMVLEASFGKSKASIILSLDAVPATAVQGGKSGSDARSLIRFDAEVDWQEKHRFLRFEVPTSLQSETASFETQFGVTKRPTTRNTTWEAAKFEVAAHKFCDLSEANYGLSILNDCKYGHSAEGGTLRLSLLKAATYPDAHQDEGKHTFSFAIYPHVGALGSDVVTAARIFNNPVEVSDLSALRPASVGGASKAEAPFSIENCGKECTVVLDTMKRGEEDFDYYKSKGSGRTTVVLRLYESLGAHAEVMLKSSSKLDVNKLVVTNLLEDAEEDSVLEQWETEDGGASVMLTFRPFEVKTIKAVLAA